MSNVDLDDALRKGVISSEQYEALRANAGRGPISGEPVRVVNRFSEVFLTIGLLIAAMGVSSLTGADFEKHPGAMTSAWIALAAVTGEAFWRTRRARLPVITTTLLAAFAAYGGISTLIQGMSPRDLPLAREAIPYLGVLALLVLGLVRYRIPFLIGPLGVTVALIAVFASGWLGNLLLGLLGLAGVGFLGAAVWLDRTDPQRTGEASQHAFWAYLVGSPMLLHPIFITLIVEMVGDGKTVPPEAWMILIGLTALVTLLGLILDRRAPVNATFLYVALMLGQATQNVGMTSLAIGLYIIALGFGWERLRRAVLSVPRLRQIAPDRAYLAPASV